MNLALENIADLLRDETGIDVRRTSQLDPVARHVEQRMRALGLSSLEAYAASLRSSDNGELALLENAVTIGHTWFGRDPEQMDLLRTLLAELPRQLEPIQIWVPGCATGEDAYGAAIAARDASRDFAVLGSDLNTRFIEKAKLASSFETRAGKVIITHDLSRRVRFAHHNLMHAPLQAPRAGGWDLILCRNVIIYFDFQRAHETVVKLARALSPTGYLLLGASELVHSLPADLRLVEIRGRMAVRRAENTREEKTTAPALRRMPLPGDDVTRAIESCVATLETKPLDIEARLMLGIALVTEGDLTGAINALRAALFLDRNLWPAFFYLALAYEGLGEHEKARLAYRRVREGIEAQHPVNGELAYLDLERWKAMVATHVSRSLADEDEGSG